VSLSADDEALSHALPAPYVYSELLPPHRAETHCPVLPYAASPPNRSGSSCLRPLVERIVSVSSRPHSSTPTTLAGAPEDV
jgi:hypothetical protein